MSEPVRVGLLLTEVQDADRLMALHPEEMVAAISQHDALVHAAVTAAGGRVVKAGGEGQSTFCVFPDPGAAGVAALAVARSLEGVTAPLRVRVKLAVHVGLVEERDGDYYGPEVNRCARLRAAAHAGQVVLTSTAAEACGGLLTPAASLVDLGVHRLKDLDAPEHVSQLRHPELPASFPPLRSLERARHNLPGATTTFLGREDEIVGVRDALAGAQLVTLTGIGGTGKTRLSLEVAGSLLDDHPDGVWFVELAPLHTGALVPNAVAAPMGLRDEPGRPMADTLVDHLRPKRALLILDNCEHLSDEVAALLDRVLDCPHVTVLATSQRPLGCRGEVLWRVPPLAVPDATASALDYPSVRLFLERARAVAPHLVLDDADLRAVVAVIRQLDGIPLAIELAAARVATVPPRELVDRLGERFGLLVGGDPTALPRQRTLRALVDWSFDLLDPAEQALLSRMSVFSGGCSLEAAEQVCAGGVVDELDVLDLLGSLVAKSLVVSTWEGDAARYGLLETIRAYAADHLASTGERDDVVSAYTGWAVDLGARAGEGLYGGQQAQWHDVLEEELDNLRNVLTLARSDGRLEVAYRLASSVWRFWWIRGYLGEGRQWLDGALRDISLSPPVRAQALHAAGALAWDQGDFRDARYLLSAARAVFIELGDLVGQGHAEHKLASVVGLQGHSEQCRAMIEDCLALADELGDVQLRAEALGNLARVRMQEGDPTEAAALWTEALQGHRVTEDCWGIMACLGDLGETAFHRGERETAKAMLDESLDLARVMKDRWRIAQCLATLGQLAVVEGDRERGRDLCRSALLIRREIGERVGLADALEDLALLAGEEQEHAVLMRVLGAVDALREELGVPLRPLREQARGVPVAAAVEALGEAVAEALWQQGAQQGLDAALMLVGAEDEVAQVAA